MNNQSDKIYFEEIQQFRQPWIWWLTAPLSLFGIAVFIYIMAKQLLMGQPVGNRPMPDSTLKWFGPLMMFIIAGIPLLLYFMKLHVKVASQVIHVRFFPFLKKQLMLKNIVSSHARQYKPIKEFGGWGVRWGPGGRAYNVSGDWGVQFDFIDGRKLMIGSQRAEEFAAAIETAKKT
jgi:hypothetical protein